MTDFAIIGIAVFLGIIGGRFFDKIGIPEVVGIVLIGVILGESFLGILSIERLDHYKPLVDLALAFFGFFIGAELKFEELRKLGLIILSILSFEVIFTFSIVATGVYLFTGEPLLAILFGTLAISTAPAATADVIWEYGAAGELTTTILALVGFDDIATVFVYSITSTYVIASLEHIQLSILDALGYFMNNIGLAIVIGTLFGAIMTLFIRILHKKKDVFVMAIGIVILTSGIAEIFEASEIISTMIVGILFANFYKGSDSAIDTIRELSAPIFTVFFVLIGARMNISLLPVLGLTGVIYLGLSMLGKTSGSTFGAWLAKAGDNIKKNIGISLYSQAGIALGLATHLYFSLKELGPIGIEYGTRIVNTLISATLILLIIGPIMVKLALRRAGEIGRIRREELVFEK